MKPTPWVSSFDGARIGLLLAAFLLGMLVGCAPSQLMTVQCPESGHTYCPAQHFDSVKVKR